jgi:hypothetical protein
MPREWKNVGFGAAETIRAALASPATYATTLLVVLLDSFGTDALAWDPNTVQMEVEQEYGVDLPPPNFDRLMTAVSLLTTDSFYTSTPDFARACAVFSGRSPTADMMILPDCDDIAWGMTEGMLIDPPEGDGPPFSEEILALIGHALDQEGILTPPDVLRMGTRDRDVVDQARYDYSDDPEMFGAIQQEEAGKTDSINHLVKARMRGLIQQLKALPLRTGKVQELAEKLLAGLPGDEDLPLPT